MPPEPIPSKSDRAVERQTYAPIPFTVLYDGAEIPFVGSAVKDGDFYLFGNRAGRVLSVQYSAAGIWVSYLEASP